MKKTKKNFIDNYSSNPVLAKLVLEQGGVDWSDIVERPYDYYDPSSGSVPGMIYYTDTVAFAEKNHLKILQALEEFEAEMGEQLNKPRTEDETAYYNWMAWFAWELCMGEVQNYLES
jgi:hypothetical protein